MEHHLLLVLTARLQSISRLGTELSRNIYERGVDGQGFARIRLKGDAALFGGNNTMVMKTRLDVPDARPLADFLPTVTLAAKNLATEMTNHNVKQNDLKGEPSITGEHVQNNRSVRDMLGDRGIKPEELPPEEDLKKLERRVSGTEKKLGKAKGLLKGKKVEKE
jgi:DNA-damage-inducible protein D